MIKSSAARDAFRKKVYDTLGEAEENVRSEDEALAKEAEDAFDELFAEVELLDNQQWFSDVFGKLPVGEPDIPVNTYFHMHDEWKAERPEIADHLHEPDEFYVPLIDKIYDYCLLHTEGHLRLIGPQSSGKTSLPRFVAAKLGRPVWVQPMHPHLEAHHFIEEKEVNSEGTFHVEKPYTWMMRYPAIIVADEYNRIDPALGVGQNTLLNDRRGVLPSGRMLNMHPECWFTATDNTKGLGDGEGDFIAFKQDNSMLDRFAYTVEMPMPVRDIQISIVRERAAGVKENVAKDIVSLGMRIDDAFEKGLLAVKWSNRRSVAMARAAVRSSNFIKGFRLAYINTLSDEDEKQLVAQLYRDLGFDRKYGDL